MNYSELKSHLEKQKVELVAVSKTKPIEEIKKLYDQGQRIFGENKVQEILAKAPLLPNDVKWHIIGHLQKNKVKSVLPFTEMIQSIDSFELLEEVNKEAIKIDKTLNVLLEMKIAQEETKYGFEKNEILDVIEKYNSLEYSNIRICGLMGMASFSDDESLVRNEFKSLKELFDKVKSQIINNNSNFNYLSMGMSGDYLLAIEEGSNMVRIGSLLFGSR